MDGQVPFLDVSWASCVVCMGCSTLHSSIFIYFLEEHHKGSYLKDGELHSYHIRRSILAWFYSSSIQVAASIHPVSLQSVSTICRKTHVIISSPSRTLALPIEEKALINTSKYDTPLKNAADAY